MPDGGDWSLTKSRSWIASDIPKIGNPCITYTQNDLQVLAVIFIGLALHSPDLNDIITTIENLSFSGLKTRSGFKNPKTRGQGLNATITSFS
jgi:hypothetical protein